MVRDCFDPKIYGPGDETETIDDGDGNLVTTRKDWFRPPLDERCPCQSGEVVQPCNCGKGALPTGVCTRLFWDKINFQNR